MGMRRLPITLLFMCIPKATPACPVTLYNETSQLAPATETQPVIPKIITLTLHNGPGHHGAEADKQPKTH